MIAAQGESPGFLILFILVTCGVSLAIWYVRHREEQRRKAMFMAWAAQHRLRYHHRPPWRGNDSFPGLPFPALLRSCRFTHVFETEFPGADGRSHRIRWREATYEIGTGRCRRTVHAPIAVATVGSLAMPGVEIRPESLRDRVAAAAGWDDLDFESVEFSRRFHVKSQDKRFAFELIDVRMMETLLGMPDSMHAAVGGPWLAVWHLPPDTFLPKGSGRHPLTLSEIERTRGAAMRLLAGLPRTLFAPPAPEASP